jgi:signal transduction histidine kinase
MKNEHQKVANNTAKAQIERLQEELQQYVHSISHDLSAPLRAISGFLEVILKNNSQKFDEKTKRHFDLIHSSVIRGQNLLEGVNRVARIETEAKEPCNCDIGVVEKVLESLAHEIEIADAKIHCKDLPCFFADEAQLATVFFELISNAVRYKSADISCEINICGYTDDNFCYFEVGDNGMGIAPEHHESVFNMFRTLDADKNTLGIGLTLCKKIIDRHGGEISIESIPQQTKVMFSLPKS